ncbi:MAG: hypothetical protein KDB54_10115 [Solirubrobacterales bacterium]|nr:hypothetical protein [Solirubrobacterales bacterium]HRV59541.1 hypothetical protein [Solirubrobacterales bacterium]
MRNPFTIGAATLAVVLSLGLAACGSSDDSGDSGEDTLTKSELITQADQICQKGNQELQKLAADAFPGNSQPSTSEVASFISDEIVPHYRDEVDQLRALNPDEADSSDWNNVVDTFEKELDAVEEDPQVAAKSSDPFTESSAAAKDFGLKVCGAS